MRNAFAAIGLMIAASAGTAAPAATYSFSYVFDSFASVMGDFLGTEAGGVFTVTDVIATVSSTGGSLGAVSFDVDTTLGGYHISGNQDVDPATFAVDGSSFDIAVVGLPVSNICIAGQGFCLLGGFASVTLPDGSSDTYNLLPSNFSETSAVPLPASLPMLGAGAGLLGLLVARRKRMAGLG